MAEEREGVPESGLALNAALLAAAGSDEARILLRKQARLVDLQITDLEREDQLRHWSMRVRHVSDVLKLGFELAAVAIVTAVAAFIGGAVWTASHDNALVIESFAVPADMAANGQSGEVIAKQLQDRLAWMQDHTDTIRQANTYRNNFADDVKVQIPDTGVSVGELYRILVNWLGHQTHITGEVWRGPRGLSLSVRSGPDAATFDGPVDDLQAMIGKAAERVYWQTQPYRYVVFLDESGRHTDSVKFAWMLALHGEESERAWAYARLALSASEDGDFENSLRLGRIAAALNPRLALIWGNLAGADVAFGHDEDALRHNLMDLTLLKDPAAARQLGAYAVADDILAILAMVSEARGDYSDAIAREKVLKTMPAYSGSDLSAEEMLAADLPLDHDISAPPPPTRLTMAFLNQVATGQYSSDYPPLPEYERAAAAGDWEDARDWIVELLRLPVIQSKGIHWIVPVLLWPKLALADAMVGDTASAEALIARTPRDCYLCMRVRGQIEAREHHWGDAVVAFASAAKLGPSMPFAYLEWGEMLMAKGDLDGAIAKFESAHAIGPHFADPLEMWGEALIAKNCSDLAQAKFDEAAKFAPNWGRLHLKWGEALVWSGKKAEAKKQFSISSKLGMSSDAEREWRTTSPLSQR